MATRVWTSAQVQAPVDKVWEKVRPLNFAYLSAVTSCELEGKVSVGEVGGVRKITYADKTVQRIKLTQLSDAEHSLTWELIESTPAVTVMSAVYSARLRRVTENNSTFIEFCADFSKDADTNVTQDCKFKQQEHIEALRKACVRKPKNWMPLESDPELMNNYMYKLGVDETKFAFHEVLGTDDDLLAMCPQPVYAVLMLFPYTDPQEEWAKKEEALIEKKGQTESKSVWYMKQTVGNACGTIGLIHVAMNNAAKLGLDPKKFFGKFHKETQKLTPDQRAEALEASDDIEAAHEATASEGGSAVEEKTNENLHFIAFTMVDGDLYELDGCKSRPINHGKTSEKTLLKDSARIIKEFMKRDPKDIRFNIVALGDKAGDDE